MLASILFAVSAQAAAAVSPLRPELRPLAFLAGSCWRGLFPDGRQTDTHCFTAFYGGAFLRDRHVVEGGPRPYSGVTLYRWDAATRAIRYDYYASSGAHSGGPVAPRADGLAFPEESVQDRDGAAMTIRSSWRRDGEGAYVARAEAREGAGWRELWRMRLERTGPAPAD